ASRVNSRPTPAPHSPTTPLSLHDALPIFEQTAGQQEHQRNDCKKQELIEYGDEKVRFVAPEPVVVAPKAAGSDRNGVIEWHYFQDRKSTRLNSSHQIISYAVFCSKKKKKT